ncbi:MAG TPA: segregation/condensation protein A [Pyrinomonadaceae bacterium]|nr:segregation/condensation protein A [Pyrinomonadaceae bacterium]
MKTLSSEKTETNEGHDARERDAEATTVAAASGQPISVAGASPEIFADRSGDELRLILGEFAGPLDLLLYLIRQEQVSIYDIPLARITDEYLRYLNMMQTMDIAVASDFLVMAAQLIEIKSRMLLPPDPNLSDEEAELLDPRRELIDRLLEHQKYKAAAEMLWSRATVERAVYARAALETDKNNPEVSAGAFDLLRVFQEILARKKEEVLLEIERDEMTMTEMLEKLRNMIFSAGELNLRAFFEGARSRHELVLAFLSVLELVRTTEIRLYQPQTFGDIIARAGA